MNGDDSPGFHAWSPHASQSPDDATDARAPSLYQTTSYVFDDAADAAAQFTLEKPGRIYSRLVNPTVGMLQERFALLEGSVGMIAASSGMAAFGLVTFLLASTDGNIVSASSLYGGTYTYFTHTVERHDVTTRFVDTLDVDAYEAAINDDITFVHLETIGDSTLVTPDVEATAEVTHSHGTPLFVDNMLATPYLCNPTERDADLVWKSTTKWIHRADTTIGGILVGGGNFPWDKYTDNYPKITKPDPAYHDINLDETFGPAGFTYTTIARDLRDLGSAQSPLDAWQTLEKLESPPLWMRVHCESAQAVAEFLDDHERMSWMNYPGLGSRETHEEVSKYLDDGYGGVITFGLADGYEAAKGTVNNVELTSLLANVGDAKTLVIHPASTTRQQLTNDEQATADVTPGMVRLSIGIEDAGDIVDDLDQTIRAASN